jgi:hypothetical protein
MDLNLTLTANPNTKDLLLLNQIQSIKSSVKNIILTRRGERIHNPNFGCDLYSLLFTVPDSNTANDLITEIRSQLTIWEPRITIDNITIELQDDQYTIIIYIYYTIKELNTTDSTTVSLLLDR